MADSIIVHYAFGVVLFLGGVVSGIFITARAIIRDRKRAASTDRAAERAGTDRREEVRRAEQAVSEARKAYKDLEELVADIRRQPIDNSSSGGA